MDRTAAVLVASRCLGLLSVVVAGLACAGVTTQRTSADRPEERTGGRAGVSAGARAVSGVDDPAVARGILRRRGQRIVDATGQEVRWRGVGFGNRVWGGVEIPSNHHDEADYARVRELGMNAVRFYIHYRTLEDDDAPGQYKTVGWRWLDDNIAWARRHGIYLILSMTVPQGGYQSNGEGRALWETPSNQQRLVNLWRAIAARYANEPIIAGYDLLNEPCVPNARSEWQALAARLAAAVREVDKNHILIIERVNAVAKVWENDANLNFVTIDDQNVVYTFHFYDPLTYTHQFASWVNLGEGGRWPDEGKVGRSEYAAWPVVATFASAPLPAGDSSWTRAETKPVLGTEPRAQVARIVLVAHRLGPGRAIFDELSITERKQTGAQRPQRTRAQPAAAKHPTAAENATAENATAEDTTAEDTTAEIRRIDLDTAIGWWFRAKDGRGRALRSSISHDGRAALTVEGTTDEATATGAQLDFRVRPGHAYVLSGWMRGERLPPDAVVQIRLDVVDPGEPLRGWTKDFLRAEIDRYVAWGRTHDVPVFLGEFGAHRPCFENGRGGVTWVADMLELIEERHLSFTYHDYHSDSFGLYLGNGRVNPNRKNAELVDLFRRTLTAR